MKSLEFLRLASTSEDLGEVLEVYMTCTCVPRRNFLPWRWKFFVLLASTCTTATGNPKIESVTERGHRSLEVGEHRDHPLEFGASAHVLHRRDVDNVNDLPDTERKHTKEELCDAAAHLALVS